MGERYVREKVALEYCLDYMESCAEEEIEDLLDTELDALIHACHLLADVAQKLLNE